MARGFRPNRFWNAVLHASATNLAATGNTGIIATDGGTGSTIAAISSGAPAIFPLYFIAVGNNMATDETNDLKIDWYGDSAGNGGIVGTTTFDQLTAGSLTDFEAWPGDVTAYDAGRDMVPVLPYMKITYTLAGSSKSMGFTIYMSYVMWTDR